MSHKNRTICFVVTAKWPLADEEEQAILVYSQYPAGRSIKGMMNSDAPEHPSAQTNSSQQPEAHRERARPSAIEQAARGSWLAPAAAMVLAVLTWKMPHGTGSRVISIINGLLLLIGLCAGIFALNGAMRNQLRSAAKQAGIGVGLCGLIIIPTIWGYFFSEPVKPSVATTVPASNPAAVAQKGPDIIFDYPGWLGAAVEDKANLVLVSIPDDAPDARQFKRNFAKDFSIIMLTVDSSRATFDVYVDTSRAIAHFSDGRTVEALPIRGILESATQDRDKYFATWMPPIRCTPGSSHVFNLFIPVPAGTVYTIMDRVTIQVNGLPVDIHGQYCTAEEKAQRLQRPSR